jgi:DNA repair exonuclease SbcCD nuclease subunit
MRIAFIADVHVGNHKREGGPVVAGVNRRCTQILDVLRRALIASRDCAAVVIAGDLLDSSKTEPQVLAATREVLADVGEVGYLLLGNHEMQSATPGDNSLRVLAESNVCVHESPRAIPMHGGTLLLVPFHPGDAREWLPVAVAEVAALTKGPRVLAIHLGIIDQDTPPFLQNAHDAVPVQLLRDLMRKHGIDAVVAGNWHSHKTWDDGAIVQIGALVPTGWDNPGLDGYGSLIVVETHGDVVSVDRREIPGPRFVDVGSTLTLPQTPEGTQLYARVRVPGGDVSDARSRGDQLVSAGRVAALAVQVDGTEARIAARESAAAARSAETLDESLAGYVARMTLPVDVDRAAVLALTRRFLAGGAA